MIEWFQRWRRSDTQLAERRVLKSRCGHYKVEESNIKYGRVTDSKGNYLGYPVIYRAMVLLEWGWWILGYHKKSHPAQKAIEYFAEHGHPMPKKKKRKKVKPE